jgi:peptidoglycan/xylan/chitin deacetylase (PgdA/CDA1 family)
MFLQAKYLIPGYIDSGDFFWWQEGNHLVSRTRKTELTLEGRLYHLDQPQERDNLAQYIFTRLSQTTSIAEREAFLSKVRELMPVSSSIMPEEKPMLPLQWDEVREMDESGLVSFGAHTMHHPILSYLTDSSEMQSEIEQCRSALEHRLGHPVRAFAYPVGQRQHIGDAVIDAVQQAGYDWAFTTTYGFNTPQTNPYLLRRIEADASQHWLVVAAEAAGLWRFFSWLRWIPAIRRTLLRNVPV